VQLLFRNNVNGRVRRKADHLFECNSLFETKQTAGREGEEKQTTFVEGLRARTKMVGLGFAQDTRISRGDAGSVFVLVKDVSLQAQLKSEVEFSAEFEE
jgi:hypothetical protein